MIVLKQREQIMFNERQFLHIKNVCVEMVSFKCLNTLNINKGIYILIHYLIIKCAHQFYIFISA